MVKDIVYLKYGFSPTLTTNVYCNKCGKIINAGPNYKPKFCDNCGETVEDLSNVDWKNEDVMYIDYVNYILNNESDYIIVKIDKSKIKPILEDERIPVLIGKDMESIVQFAQREHSDYNESCFVPATKQEILEYAKYCGKFWHGNVVLRE